MSKDRRLRRPAHRIWNRTPASTRIELPHSLCHSAPNLSTTEPPPLSSLLDRLNRGSWRHCAIIWGVSTGDVLKLMTSCRTEAQELTETTRCCHQCDPRRRARVQPSPDVDVELMVSGRPVMARNALFRGENYRRCPRVATSRSRASVTPPFALEYRIPASTAHNRLKAASRLETRSRWQPTFLHLDGGLRTVPISTPKIQLNESVDLGGHNKNRLPTVDGPNIGLGT